MPGEDISAVELMALQVIDIYQCEQEATLYAGKYMNAGTVSVEWDGTSNVNVTYSVDDNWRLGEMHLSVKDSPALFPMNKKGNPRVGHFEYAVELEEYVSEYTFNVDVNNLDGDKIFIAAHAVVYEVMDYITDLDALSNWLPETVTYKVHHPGGDSYFNTTVNGGSALDGLYDGFCIDTDGSIYSGMDYTARVYSTYDPDFASLGVVEYPENIHFVNYILNQHFVGKHSLSGGIYTYGDVQRAIWTLIEDEQSNSGLESWSQTRVDEILNLAYTNGETFVPSCGETVAVVLSPEDGKSQITIIQVTLIQIPVVCIPVFGGNETAWAGEYEFAGNSWARFFPFCR